MRGMCGMIMNDQLSRVLYFTLPNWSEQERGRAVVNRPWSLRTSPAWQWLRAASCGRDSHGSSFSPSWSSDTASVQHTHTAMHCYRPTDRFHADRNAAFNDGGSVRPSVCHTRNSRRNGSRYRNEMYFAPHDRAMLLASWGQIIDRRV